MENNNTEKKETFYCTEYVNKAGKVMRAKDYGYKAWPFLARKKKKQ